MALIEFMQTVIEGLEIGDPIEIYLTRDRVLFRQISYDPKTELFTDRGWVSRQTTKGRKKKMEMVSLSTFLFPNEALKQ